MPYPRSHVGPAPRPTKPPPPQVQDRNKKKAPTCLECDRKAKKLRSPDGRESGVKYFCSFHCAANWALRYLPASNFIWCADCKLWTDELGLCHCDRQLALAEVGEQIAAADRKEVAS